MNNPDAPYLPPQTAAQQTMQQPQSGPKATTGGAGYGTKGALPQAPGKYSEQPGAKSLTALVAQFMEALYSFGLSASGNTKIQEAGRELLQAAKQADEELKQTGLPQYPAAPPPASLGHPPIHSKN